MSEHNYAAFKNVDVQTLARGYLARETGSDYDLSELRKCMARGTLGVAAEFPTTSDRACGNYVARRYDAAQVEAFYEYFETQGIDDDFQKAIDYQLEIHSAAMGVWEGRRI